MADADPDPGADAGADPGAEWLETDGFGGYAMGTVGGVRTRRYHGLLVVADPPPARRLMLVNGLVAWLERDDGASLPLFAQAYAPDVTVAGAPLAPGGFSAMPWPSWRWRLPDGTVLGFALFVAAEGAETVLRWQAPPACRWRLVVRPLISGRDHHALHRENPDFRFDATCLGGNASWRPYAGLPAITALSNGHYTHAPDWYRQFRYAGETARGLDDTEDLATPGLFRFDLAMGDAVLIFRPGDALWLHAGPRAAQLAEAEARRRGAMGLDRLRATAFMADRAPGRTLIAGYPWFTDWGRDSFIALRGLCLAMGDVAAARAILRGWAGLVDQGMLPNRFPDDGGVAEFNSVDAALWFIVAGHDYMAAAPADADTESRLGRATLAIIAGYRAGTRYRICMDAADGLIAAGVPGLQLTWMDARCGDHVVTPRIGKPVEIQALWYNALRIGARWDASLGGLADQVRASVARRFARPLAGGLYDVIDADHVAGRLDGSVRPNQIFTIGGLPYATLDGALAGRILDEVEEELLTPMGLRTLSRSDPAYCPRYGGPPMARDGAYHQGTVWPWLLTAFVDAWLDRSGRSPAARAAAARRFLPALAAHRATVGLGHVTEVCDGDAPHAPGGCPAQAWSLGEYLRLTAMLGCAG